MIETTLGCANPIAMLLCFSFALTTLAVTYATSQRSRAFQQVRLAGLIIAGASTFSRDLYPSIHACVPVLWHHCHAGSFLAGLVSSPIDSQRQWEGGLTNNGLITREN